MLVAVLLPGCRSGSALHGRYDNFRAFYNTYYNASRKLDEGERAVQAPNAQIDVTRLVELFPSGTGDTGARNPAFQAAIDKSAELLRNRPGSAWADDALLVIGKAYFYQRNFVGAEQKFRETAAAADLQQNRRLADEARFWLGRTLASAGRYDEGVGVLQEGLALEGGNRRWRAQMALALAELYAWAGRWDDAAPALREGLADVRDADLAGRGYLLLGQVEEAAGRYAEAAEAYERSAGRQASYEIVYAASLSRALVLGLDTEQRDEALALVRTMRRDDKNYARRAEVALANARVLAASGRPDEAEALYRDILYDEALAGQIVRGQAHARLAEFYRDVRQDFVRAAAHFDTAATALPGELTPADRPSREALVGVGRQATTFGGVSATSGRLAEIDSLLALGALDDDAFAARIAAIEAVRRETYLIEQRRLAAVRDAQNFGGTVTAAVGGDLGRPGTGAGANTGTGEEGPPPAQGGAPPSGVDAGFLNFRDIASVQSGLITFQRQFGERPLVPHWRRQAAVEATAVASAVGGGAAAGRLDATAAGGPTALDLTTVPRTPEQQRVLLSERASLRYELGNAFFLALGRADLARGVYQRILEETPDEPVALRARYALAELEAADGNETLARDLYTAVVAADAAGPLGRAAQARLDGREPDLVPDVSATAAADSAYAEARATWSAGRPLAAAVALVRLGDAAPDAAVAPRAYYAAAVAYTDWAAGDTLALRAPLPDSLVSTVLREVPRAPAAAPSPTPVGDAVRPPARRAEVDDLPVDTRRRPAAAPTQEGAPPPAGAPPPVGAPPVDGTLPVKELRSEETPPEELPSEEAPPADSLLSAAALAGEPEDGAPDAAVAPPAQAPPAVAADASFNAVPDSAVPPRLAVAEAPDSTAATFTLEDHLNALVSRYGQAAVAGPARALLAALPRPAVPAAVSADSLAPGVPGAPPALPDDEGVVDAAGVAQGLRGGEPLDPTAGGFTWKTQTFAEREGAEILLAPLRTGGYRVALATDGSLFYVLIGQFETHETADAAREELPAWAQGAAVLLPIRGFTLVGAAGAPSTGAPTDEAP